MAPRSPNQTSSSELPKTNIRPSYSRPRHQPTGRVISEDASIPLSTSDSTQFNTEATPKSISPQRPDHPLIYRTQCSYQPKQPLDPTPNVIFYNPISTISLLSRPSDITIFATKHRLNVSLRPHHCSASTPKYQLSLAKGVPNTCLNSYHQVMA